MVRLFYAFLALLILGGHVPAALAADASVTISSPQNGARFSPEMEVDVVYDVTLGPNGNHAHLYVDSDAPVLPNSVREKLIPEMEDLYVDSREPVVLRALKGSYSVGKLPVGLHKICINVVNKAHAPVGAQACVNVTVE